jgi:hypothetical protein
LKISSIYFVLLVGLYVVVFVAAVTPQSRVVTVQHIHPTLFAELRYDHGETLSCPCSTTIVPYKVFVSNTISFHPICSSVFVSKEWIEALYLPYTSASLITDFRTTAKSQVSEYLL